MIVGKEPDRRRAALVRRTQRTTWLALTVGPGATWLVLLLFLPLVLLAVVSFFERGDYGELSFRFTFENYRRLAGFGTFGFDPLYPWIGLRSLGLAGLTTVACLLAGVPLTFALAGLTGRWRNLGLLLLVLPLWTNLLIRTYAWQLLLGPGGALANAAVWLGWVRPGEGLYPSFGAVALAMACDLLPFMVLPLYASVLKIDWTLAEAARDLGATPTQAFRHAVWPQIVPGLAAGSVLVFLPALGQFVVPDLLGGAKTAMLGNVIQQQFATSRDWPFGAALTVSALALMLGGLLLHRAAGRRAGTSAERRADAWPQ